LKIRSDRAEARTAGTAKIRLQDQKEAKMRRKDGCRNVAIAKSRVICVAKVTSGERFCFRR
jgi:hypothetical protein